MKPQQPIIVPATPTQTQAAAAVRQIILILAGAASALGFAGVAGQLNEFIAYAGPVAAVVVFVWGQVRTRTEAKKLIVTGGAAPNTVAQVR